MYLFIYYEAEIVIKELFVIGLRQIRSDPRETSLLSVVHLQADILNIVSETLGYPGDLHADQRYVGEALLLEPGCVEVEV